MSQRYLIILIMPLLILSSSLYAQKEYYNWYFGFQAGITFNTPDLAPAATSTILMNSLEGCSNISDAENKVIIVTNGEYAFIGKNKISLEGLETSTQSSLVLKKPGNNMLYYIFTTAVEAPWYEMEDKYHMSLGYRYSVIDMNTGALIEHNKMIVDSSTEKLCAVYHKNQKDIWIMMRMRVSHSYYAYLLTENGLELKTITNIGPACGYINPGYMKFSNDGKKLVHARGYYEGKNSKGGGELTIMDFDNETGELSNAFVIDSSAYGVEFSPDCSKLYFTMPSVKNEIFQIDLEAGSKNDIINSIVRINPSEDVVCWALQAGPDGRIYVAREYTDWLGVIKEPNEKGLLCNYSSQGVRLASGSFSKYGLPNYLPYPSPENYISISGDQVCYGQTLYLHAELSAHPWKNWRWYGPGSFSSDAQNPSIHNTTKLNEGWYYFEIELYGKTYTDSIYITITELDVEILCDQEPVICIGDSLKLSVSPSYSSNIYTWSTGETTSEIYVKEEGIFTLEVEDASGCHGFAEIEVLVLPNIDIAISGPEAFCEGEAIVLTTDLDDDSFVYEWSNGATGKSIEISEGGTYSVYVTNMAGCSGSDTIHVTLNPKPEAVIEGELEICPGENTILTSKNEYAGYSWSTDETTREISATAPGKYSLIVTNSFGCKDTSNVTVEYYPNSVLNIEGPEEICEGDSAVLKLNKSFESYLWSTGETSAEIEISKGGDYYVNVTNESGCVIADTISIKENPKPEAVIDGDTKICKGDKGRLSSRYEYESYLWSNGEETREITISETGEYSLKVINSWGCIDSTNVQVEYYPDPEILGGPVFCEGEQNILSCNIDYPAYEWSTGETTKDIIIDKPGMYWLKVSNENGCNAYDTIYTELYNIDFNIAGDNINFDFVLIDSYGSAELIITNNNPAALSYTFGLGGKAFELSGFTGEIPAYQSEKLLIKFSPDDIIDYNDILKIYINEPCNDNADIYLSGKGKAVLRIDIPETIAEINDYISIPVNAQIITGRDINPEVTFSADVQLDAGILLTDIHGNIQNNKRVIHFPQTLANISQNKTQIAEIKGTVLLGDRDYSAIELIDFTHDNDHLELDTNGGSLAVSGICAENLSRLSAFIPTRLLISPNPANESVNVLIESEEIGNIELKIYNLQGAEVYKESWNNSGKTVKQFNINTDDFSNGAYSLVLKSSMSVIVRNLFINK